MKTKIILLLFILVPLFSFCQGTYKSVLGNGLAKWSILVENEYPLSDEWQTYGDSVINQVKYKKVFGLNGFWPSISSGVPVNNQWRTYIPFSSYDKCLPIFLRESEDKSKIYFFDSERKEEYLIADLNLQKGDTFNLPKYAILSPFYSSQNTPFDIVDSVYYKNGLKHVQFGNIRLKSYAQDEKFTFIEGVGSNAGVIYAWNNHPFAGWGAIINCFSNDSMFYKNNNTNYDCGYIWYDDIKQIHKNDYKINYYYNKIIISFKESINFKAMIFNCQGKLIFCENKFNSNILEINKDGLANGLNLLRIYNADNKECKSLKIII